MTRSFSYILLFTVCLAVSCKKNTTETLLKSPDKATYTQELYSPEKVLLYDKVLGALVGSAIGDAMGASTEMWQRKEIQTKYGYILGLTTAERTQSPEGTWEHNLSAGATTDDTRWKYLMIAYLEGDKDKLNQKNFASFITDYYKQEAEELKDQAVSNSPDSLDIRMEKIDWIKEWARVSLAYEKGPMEYQKAQNRFYGGEMSCAGMLYTPMFGLITSTPEEAYSLAYKHTLFDIGYAKDISALVATMTQMALRTQNMDSILDATVYIDPYQYQDSRLVGRISYQIANSARKYVAMSKNQYLEDSTKIRVPRNYHGSKQDWLRQDFIYELLEKDARAIPFHAGEIWQILLAGLAFGEGDFQKTMQFIVNYGRDNDTVAAVAGIILGAKDGYTKLPDDLKQEVIRINRKQLGIDLEDMAHRMVAAIGIKTINKP